MGMYTELVLKAEIKNDVPDQVHAVLRHLFSGGDEPATLPDHQLFRKPRWSLIGRGNSFYHTPFAVSRYEDPLHPGGKGGYIFSRSDLKNYDGEIEAFLDWVNPYLEHMPGDCIGWTWYEEAEAPTLAFYKG